MSFHLMRFAAFIKAVIWKLRALCMEHFAIATQVSVCFQVLQADEAATEDAVRSHVVWRIALNKMEK